LEFAVDPLFKKTCADFDEGGARGLLLNNLMMFGNGRIIFDSSDATQTINGDEIDETPSDNAVDVSKLKSITKIFV
jgi:condensin complex subunit 2